MSRERSRPRPPAARIPEGVWAGGATRRTVSSARPATPALMAAATRAAASGRVTRQDGAEEPSDSGGGGSVLRRPRSGTPDTSPSPSPSLAPSFLLSSPSPPPALLGTRAPLLGPHERDVEGRGRGGRPASTDCSLDCQTKLDLPLLPLPFLPLYCLLSLNSSFFLHSLASSSEFYSCFFSLYAH